MIKNGILVLVVLFFTITSNAQDKEKEKKLIQFSGVILSADTLDPIPYAAVFDKSIKRATFADFSGFFSMVVRVGDTIFFSSIGHKKSAYIIPDTLSQSRYTIVQLMSPDTIYLKEAVVYPWPSREDFARAFMELELPETAFDRYGNNMTLAELKAANNDFGDALSCYDAQMGNEYSRLYSQGQIPTLNLLSPAAWKNFIKTWKSGGFKNKKKQ